jgi:pimeloyl-ACP methyl ester carboxylesterase
MREIMRLTPHRRWTWAVAVALWLGLAPAADAAKRHRPAPRPSAVRALALAMAGGTSQFVYQQCGADRTADVVTTGAAARAQVVETLRRVQVRVRRGGRTVVVRRLAAPVAATVSVQRCHDGQWNPVASVALARARSASYALDTSLAASGDYRLIARVTSNGTTLASPVAYVRVGVGEIVDDPVTFTVSNQDLLQSSVRTTCSTDGSTQVIHGHLIAPRAALVGSGPHAVTLYLHGLGYGEFFWHFTNVPGYDWATNMALAGQASVTVDRLGYGANALLDGNNVCLGAQAEMAHQILIDLRGGHYTIPYGPPAQFENEVIAGHSIGGGIAELEAWQNQDVQGLIVMSWSDLGFSGRALTEFTASTLGCNGGGVANRAGSPHYEPFGQTDNDFSTDMFDNVDPAVSQAVLGMRNPDPCGDINSALNMISWNAMGLGRYTGPVLLVYGNQDALFPPPAGSTQKAMFGNASSTTLDQFDQTGHAITLGRTAPQVFASVLSWLQSQGL